MGLSASPVDSNDSDAAESAAAARGFFGRDVIYVALMAAQAILTALLTPVTTRLLGPSQFGQAATGIAVMQLAAAVLEFGLMTGVQRIYRVDDNGSAARKLMFCGVGLSLALGFVLYVTGRWWSPAVGLGAFPPSVRYAVLWGTMVGITMPALALLRSQDRLLWFALSSGTMSLVSEALALSMVATIHRTSAVYMLGQLIGQALAAAIGLAASRPQLPRTADFRKLADTFRFSFALIPMAVASFVSAAADRLVIRGDLGLRAVAHYGIAVNIGGFSVIILSMLQFTWLPRLFAARSGAMRRELLAIARDNLYKLAVTGSLAIASGSSIILWLWAPTSFSPGHLVLITALVTATAVPTADSVVYVQALLLADRPRPVATGSVVVALANLGLNIAFVPAWGIKGSAAISLACIVVYALLMRWAARAAGPVPNHRATLFAVAGAAACVATAALPAYGFGLVPRFIIAVASATTCAVQLIRFARPDDYERLRSGSRRVLGHRGL